MSSSPLFERVIVCYGGELAKDVAQQIISKQPSNLISTNSTKVIIRNASERTTQLVEYDSKTLICFVFQTVENGAATEEVCNVVLCCSVTQGQGKN